MYRITFSITIVYLFFSLSFELKKNQDLDVVKMHKSINTYTRDGLNAHNYFN